MIDKSNPWTKVSEQVHYDNPWIRVTEHQVLTPAGRPGIYGVVHFKSIATGIIPIDDAGCTILVGQYRFPQDRYSWEIPEGGATFEEGPLAGALRELEEEAGVRAAHHLELTCVDLSNSVSDEVGHTYVAWGLTAVEAAPEDTEKLALWRLPYAEAVAMVMDGRITDGLSMLSLLKLETLRLKGLLPADLAELLGKS